VRWIRIKNSSTSNISPQIALLLLILDRLDTGDLVQIAGFVGGGGIRRRRRRRPSVCIQVLSHYLCPVHISHQPSAILPSLPFPYTILIAGLLVRLCRRRRSTIAHRHPAQQHI